MVDQLLAASHWLTDIQAALLPALPAGVDVLVTGDQSIASARTPFVVLSGRLVPDRENLAGRWASATFALAAQSVHSTQPEADALADLVRIWVLTEAAATVPGVIDAGLSDEALPTDPGNVPQVRESWTLTLVRV